MFGNDQGLLCRNISAAKLQRHVYFYWVSGIMATNISINTNAFVTNTLKHVKSTFCI